MSFTNQLKSDISNAVKLPEAFRDAKRTKARLVKLPWSNTGIDSIEKSFFKPYEIDPDRWNKMYPYRLLVFDIVKGRIVTGSPGNSVVRQQILGSQAPSFIIEQELLTGNWEVVLPITPQQLQITDQYAINTSATMRGVVEEHNGTRFKTITMGGTTGIWVRRPTVAGAITQKSSFATIFGGSLQELQNVVAGANKVATAFTGKSRNPALSADGPQAGDLFTTGYYQALYMNQFLERYTEAKRRPENKNWRLVLDIPKQNQSFIVTPQQFSMKQSAQKPNHIMYNMTLKAWKRIDLKNETLIVQSSAPTLKVNDFQKIVNTIRETRRTLSSAVNLIKAVRADFQRPFEVLRQSSLAIKQAGGIQFASVDLPRQIIADFKSTIEDSIININSSFQRPNARFRDSTGIGSFVPNAVSLKADSPEQRAGQAFEAIAANKKQSEGLSGDQINSGSLGQGAIDSAKVDPTNVIFANPEENFELFDQVPLNDLNLTPQQEDAVQDELDKIETITVDTFRDFKAEMLSLANDISNNYGVLDETYANVYGLQNPNTRAIELTIEENEVMLAIFNFIQAMDDLTATKAYDDLTLANPLEFVGGLAGETGIDFQNFPSKKPAPVPFGLTIEQIAARYLGSPDKWIEIATLNGLRSPYIDEDGYILPLLSNGTGRQFTVEDSEDRLHIGQKIVLSSDTIPQFTAVIIDVVEVLNNQYLVSIDGNADLSVLKTAQNAKMIGYLPGTVNSQNQILIPTDEPASEDDRTFEIPGLDDPQNLARLSKVDWLLTEQGDVAINSVGDVRLAVGLNNLIQALKLKIRTKKGALLRHLNYGLGLTHGVSVADIDNGSLLQSFNELIEQDDRFLAINRLQIELLGATLKINLSVQIASNGGVLPISFDVPAR